MAYSLFYTQTTDFRDNCLLFYSLSSLKGKLIKLVVDRQYKVQRAVTASEQVIIKLTNPNKPITEIAKYNLGVAKITVRLDAGEPSSIKFTYVQNLGVVLGCVCMLASKGTG